jgi:uncharacterized membrane protein
VTVTVQIPAEIGAGITDTATITATSQSDPGKFACSTLTTLVNAAHGVSLKPLAAAQSGNPGETVAYTLHLTNIGNALDTFGLTVSGNHWATTVPTTTGLLAAGSAVNVAVSVTIPAGAAAGATDAVTITAASPGDAGQWAASTLTTTAIPYRLYLPLIVKSPARLAMLAPEEAR